eukprot:SAG11_NODE_6822_length_1240_cov_1.145486_1_plen_172_part_00
MPLLWFRYGYPSEYPRQIWPTPGVLERQNFPCVTMLDWADGTGIARFWILKMMIDALGGSETLKSVVETTVRQQQQHVYAKGFAIRDAKCAGSDLEHCPLLRRVVLLVNRGNASTTIEVRGATGSNASVVDYSAGHGHTPLLFYCPRQRHCDTHRLCCASTHDHNSSRWNS